MSVSILYLSMEENPPPPSLYRKVVVVHDRGGAFAAWLAPLPPLLELNSVYAPDSFIIAYLALLPPRTHPPSPMLRIPV